MAESINLYIIILLTKITAAQNEVAHNYHNVRGLYILPAVFAAIIVNVGLSKISCF